MSRGSRGEAWLWVSASAHLWQHVSPMRQVEPPAKKVATPAEDDEDNDIDLFGSGDEEEDKEAARLREERLRQYAEKKAKKPVLVAKSSILLDVKPVSRGREGLREGRSPLNCKVLWPAHSLSP